MVASGTGGGRPAMLGEAGLSAAGTLEATPRALRGSWGTAEKQEGMGGGR